MVGWHHQLRGHEFEQTMGNSDGQGSLACCCPWGCKELDTTERLNNNISPEPSYRQHKVGVPPCGNQEGPEVAPSHPRSPVAPLAGTSLCPQATMEKLWQLHGTYLPLSASAPPVEPGVGWSLMSITRLGKAGSLGSKRTPQFCSLPSAVWPGLHVFCPPPP